MANFEKGKHIRNKFNGLVYVITEILTVSYEIEDVSSKQKWLLPFENENEWEMINVK